MRRIGGLVLAAIAVASPALAQQVADTTYAPPVIHPRYPAGVGPVILIDEAHHNSHTAEGSYRALARLLERDGYRVEAGKQPFSAAALDGATVLVISNALAAENVDDWYLPTPSAFTQEEIHVVEEWVRGGGALLLVADHMPFPGAAEDLAGAFGIWFQNGFVMDPDENGRITFRRSDGSLVTDPIAEGDRVIEEADSVTTFTGQAFRVTAEAEPLLIVPEGYELLLPEIAWQFSKRTPRIPAVGLYQGVVVRHGAGRVAAFGEAAMFTAQRIGSEREPMGMNHPAAAHNHRFVLKLVHWLTGFAD